MVRTTLGALLMLLAALPSRAQQDGQNGPVVVSAKAVQADVDQLRDAVASPAQDNLAVHSQATAFFDGVPGHTPSFRPAIRLMDRERVDGHVGTVEGMIDEAQKRFDHFKFLSAEVPDVKLSNAIAYAKDLNAEKRIQLDPSMAENQMGEYSYQPEKAAEGVIKLNQRLTLLATRVGEAFCYATLVHEAAHAKAGSEGRLDPKHTIDNELEAYRVQYLWLKLIDPRAERMIVLHSELRNQLRDHPEDKISRMSFSYIVHLLELWDTGGEDGKLRDLIKKLGYQDGGVDPAATGMRA